MNENHEKNNSNIITTQNGVEYSINEKEKTASIVGLSPLFDDIDLHIPRFIYHDMKKYIITSISANAIVKEEIRNIDFAVDSEVKKIEKFAFQNSLIRSINIPASLVELEERWCCKTNDLTIINISLDNPRYFVYNKKYIFGKSSIEKDTYDSLVFCVRDIKNAIIPNFIEIIEPDAFGKCKYLQKVEFQNDSKLSIISQYAFLESSIESITIPSHTTIIDDYAFHFCRNLCHIEIKNDSELKTIGRCAFYNSAIESITIPPNLVELREEWCRETSFLNTIKVLPNNPLFSLFDGKFVVKKSSFDKKDYDVLVMCARNAESIQIPSFIEIIGSNAFENCKKVREIIFSTESKLRIIENYAFACTSIKSFIFPSNLKKIGMLAFYHCINLQNIVFPSNSKLEIIDQFAFRLCSFEKVTLPSHLNKVDEGAFVDCRKLKEVDFSNCFELKSLEGNTFANSSIESISIPSNIIELKDSWCQYTRSLNKIDVDANNSMYSIYQDIFIIGKSSIEKQNYDVLVFCVRNIKKVTIPNFIEIIGSYSFNNCDSIQEIEFPIDSRLRIISQYAFCQSSIKTISIPHQVTKIYENSFCDCVRLQKVEIPIDSELEIIEKRAFSQTSIQKISIPSSLIRICEEAFADSIIQNIQFPENSKLQTIDDLAFIGSLITSILIPSHVTKIGESAFDECYLFQIMEIDEFCKLKEIDVSSFPNNDGLIVMISPKLTINNLIQIH